MRWDTGGHDGGIAGGVQHRQHRGDEVPVSGVVGQQAVDERAGCVVLVEYGLHTMEREVPGGVLASGQTWKRAGHLRGLV